MTGNAWGYFDQWDCSVHILSCKCLYLGYVLKISIELYCTISVHTVCPKQGQVGTGCSEDKWYYILC